MRFIVAKAASSPQFVPVSGWDGALLRHVHRLAQISIYPCIFLLTAYTDSVLTQPIMDAVFQEVDCSDLVYFTWSRERVCTTSAVYTFRQRQTKGPTMGKGAGVNLPVDQTRMESAVMCSEGSFLPVKRSFNFCAGPAMLDSDAMATMWRDFCSWQGSGVSLIEMSQRDKGGPVQTMIADAVGNIRKLLSVPDNYKILLFQGGAHGQFAACPLNLTGALHARVDGWGIEVVWLDSGMSHR